VKDVAQKGSPVVVDNALQDEQFSGWQSVTMYNIMSILCVPLKIKGQIIGTIYLDNRSVPGIFSARDVSFLESFSNLTAMAIENAKLYSELHGENVYLKEELDTKYRYDNIVGNSKIMQDIFNVIEKVSPSRASVLILGESGTGKELVARLIHYSSPRNDKSFLKVNCAALTESLLESELFGIEEKIATGVKSRKGKFELAHGGTIFLDEIGDMSLSTQAKVLRVLQEQEFERVGGSETIKVDVRIISATNQDLREAIAQRKFRKDLFYRLDTVTISLPALRDRKEDVPFLVDYFVKKYCRENEKKQIIVPTEVMETFMRYDWPGNVRELENVVQRGVVMAEGKLFPVEFVPSIMEGESQEMTFSLPAGPRTLDDILDFIERATIEKALREHGFVQVKAAAALGLSESALRYKMRKHGMKK
jgi:transcriptional regulator with GAF, ATPase, and Fis domain